METYFETRNGNCIYISTEKKVGTKTRMRVWNGAKNKTYRFYSNSHMYEIAKNIDNLEYAIAKLFKTDTINILTEQLTIIID